MKTIYETSNEEYGIKAVVRKYDNGHIDKYGVQIIDTDADKALPIVTFLKTKKKAKDFADHLVA